MICSGRTGRLGCRRPRSAWWHRSRRPDGCRVGKSEEGTLRERADWLANVVSPRLTLGRGLPAHSGVPVGGEQKFEYHREGRRTFAGFRST